ISHVERIEAEPNVMNLAGVGAQQRQAEFAVELQVQREKVGETRSVWSAHVALYYIYVGIGIAAVPVGQRAEFEFPRQRKNTPGYDTIGNIGRQNSINVRPDHRLRERYEHTRKVVEIAARPAPDIGSVDLVFIVDCEMDSTFQFAVVRTAVVGQADKRLLAGGGCKRVRDENISRVAVDVAKAQQHFLAKLVFTAHIPGQVARRRSGPLRKRRPGQRIDAADVRIAITRGRSDG